MPAISNWYFRVAILFLLAGIAMGLQMSISGNHSVIGAHAHTNLLGWVTSALFGAYYALNPAKAASRIAKIQFWVYVPSIAILAATLYLFYLGNRALEPILAIASLVAFAGALLFAYIVFAGPSTRAA